jgi:hypothetical protein
MMVHGSHADLWIVALVQGALGLHRGLAAPLFRHAIDSCRRACLHQAAGR